VVLHNAFYTNGKLPLLDVAVSYISGKIVSEFLRLVLVQHVHVGNINKVVF
jgi:hypothetical protein